MLTKNEVVAGVLERKIAQLTQIDRQIDRHIDRQTDRQTDRHIDRQVGRQIYKTLLYLVDVSRATTAINQTNYQLKFKHENLLTT